MFQGANRGGAHRHNAATGIECAIDGRSRFDRDVVRLAVQSVILHTVRAYRLKSSQTDVQCNFCSFDAAVFHPPEDLRGEVQTGGGCGHRTALPGIDRLIAFAIAGTILAGNIGRQRHVAETIDGAKEIRGWSETDPALAEASPRQHFGLKFVIIPEKEALADS